MKFKKKPVTIEAEQFLISEIKTEAELENFCEKLGVEIYRPSPVTWNFTIPTLEGRMEVRDKDWVITGVAGEKYPCKPDIFKMTYDKVEEIDG